MKRLSRFIDFINILAEPQAIFGDYKQKIDLSSFVAFNLIITFIGALLSFNIYKVIFEGIYQSSFPDAGTNELMQNVILTGIGFILLIDFAQIFLRWIVLALLIVFTNWLFDIENDIKKIAAIVIGSEVILSIMYTINILGVYAFSDLLILHPGALFVIPGLQTLFSSEKTDKELFLFLYNFNIFTIWYVYTIAIGLKVILGYKMIHAFFISCVLWNLWIGTRIFLMQTINI